MTVNKRLGIGATISIKAKLLHPSTVVKTRYGENGFDVRRVENLVVLRREEKRINRSDVDALVLRHDDFPDIELYCAMNCAKLQTAGDPSNFFVPAEAPREVTQQQQQTLPVLEERPADMAVGRLALEDVQRLRQEGFIVDDDNEPAEENIPAIAPNANVVTWNDWGFLGIDLRHENGQMHNQNARFIQSEASREFNQFWKFFPREWVDHVLIPETNRNLVKPMTPGEFTRWLGITFLISCIDGFDRRDFWSEKEIDAFEGAPYRMSCFMSRTRFEDILTALRLTNREYPPYSDKFFEVRQMIEAWNENMKVNFIPSWISCLDESMCAWLSQYSCPGWMVVPRKPHPFGNEYHTLCCGKTGIMYFVEIVEGKDRPNGLGPPMHDNKGKTVGLLLRMTEPIHNTGKVVIMDSGFCVLEGILALKDVGVYGSAVIKKRRYWPKHINGDQVNEHFRDKEVGYVDARKGVLNGKSFYLYGMKEPDYTMMLMATYGTTGEVADHGTKRSFRDADGIYRTVTFKYRVPFSNHYRYRHLVDDHNAKRHSPISIEDSLGTRSWPIRKFTFLLAVTEVNVKLGLQHNGPVLEFRRSLAKALINNEWYAQELNEENTPNTRLKKRRALHEYTKRPPYTGKYDAQTKNFSATQKEYVYLKCQGDENCKNETRGYCRCSPAVPLCKFCFSYHESM